MQLPTIGRIVIYRSKTGRYSIPAVITATLDSLDPVGVELYEQSAATVRREGEPLPLDLSAQGIPPLSSPLHVHLTVFSPGLPGNGEPPKPMDANRGGTYREWDVPFFALGSDGGPGVSLSPSPGADEYEALAGSWHWPVRV